MGREIKISEAREVGILEYNKIRRKNGLPNIAGDEAMNEAAQAHAEYLVKEGKFETTTMGNKYACNIATSSDVRIFDAVKDVVERLNKSKEKQHYLKEGCNKMGMGVVKNEAKKNWIFVLFFEGPQSPSKEPQTAKSIRNMFSSDAKKI